MQMDILTAGVGIVSFVIFFIIHVITFRRLKPEELLKSLSWCVGAIAGLPVVFMAVIASLHRIEAPTSAWMLGAVLGVLINVLLSFFYVTCIFGPYETSVRMRLVREIAETAGGLTYQELLRNYNPETIMNIRLRRLLGSGDIIEKDGVYRLGRSGNFFFLFDVIANRIKKWIGR